MRLNQTSPSADKGSSIDQVATDDAKSERELVVKKIIAVAYGGERSALLRERGLQDIRLGRI